MELTKQEDIAAMQRVAERISAVKIYQTYGQNGLNKFKLLLSQLPSIMAVLHIESRVKITILTSLGESNVLPTAGKGAKALSNYDHLNSISDSVLTIELKNNFELIVYEGDIIAVEELANLAIVYTYTSSGEYFLEKENKIHFIPLPGCDSYFVIRTFKAIEEALYSYAEDMAKKSTCKILSTAWNEEDRIFFKPAPEHIMRDSLRQFIDNFLRGSTEVRAEQNVDESHPVDIKVTWNNTNSLALIEIKWLGKSIAPDRADFTKIFSQGRALEGAEQLVKYLDWNKRRSPKHITKGYLVVFDARRKKTNVNTVSLGEANGMHYRNKDVEYNPVYENHRVDYSKPFRIFLEPECNAYS